MWGGIGPKQGWTKAQKQIQLVLRANFGMVARLENRTQVHGTLSGPSFFEPVDSRGARNKNLQIGQRPGQFAVHGQGSHDPLPGTLY